MADDWTSGFDLGDGGSDWTGGFDLPGGGDLTPEQWAALLGSQGMGDRGLGTGGGSGSQGTLTPEQIAALVGAGGAAGGGAGAGGAAGGSSALSRILQQLGLQNSGGDPNALGWLSLLAPLLGGALAYHNTGKAADQVVAGLENARGDINRILGGPSPFASYQKAGETALGEMPGVMYKPMAGQFGPLGNRPIPGGTGNRSIASLYRR